MWPIAKANGGNRRSQHQTTAKNEFSTSWFFQRHQTANQKTRHLSVIFKNIRNILWSISNNSIAVRCSDALAVAKIEQLPLHTSWHEEIHQPVFDNVITCPSGRRAGDAVRAASITCSVGPTAGSRCHRNRGTPAPSNFRLTSPCWIERKLVAKGYLLDCQVIPKKTNMVVLLTT